MTASLPEARRDAIGRIERWLLTSEIQLSGGLQRGGIAGWLDEHDRPSFVYLEITGYYLTSMAWFIAGGARSDESAALALQRGRSALEWVQHTLADGALPPTRLYLEQPRRSDWRNTAAFSFDLAMAVRGVFAFAEVTGDRDVAIAVGRSLIEHLSAIQGDSPVLRSHRLLGPAQLPVRWSTQPGPHHIKAAGVLVSVPVEGSLLAAAWATWAQQAVELDKGWPVSETHALLYGLEGLAMVSDIDLIRLRSLFTRLMDSQRPDGSLPAELPGSDLVRSDVLAQALRIGAMLRALGALPGELWGSRLERLAARLVDRVRPDGSVTFCAEQERGNAWAAMFAHQALSLHDDPDPATAAVVRRYLV
jgi:hypothetical protein